MDYDTTYFINKFKKIPKSKWCKRVYRSADGKKCCALGHCGADVNQLTHEAHALIDLTRLNNDSIEKINDAKGHPKDNVLKVLRKIKRKYEYKP